MGIDAAYWGAGLGRPMERVSADAAQDAYLRGVESLRLAAHRVQAAARERPNSVSLRGVHDTLSTNAISSWGGEIEGATGLTCQWHDQGWGNRKGMVFARAPLAARHTRGSPSLGTKPRMQSPAWGSNCRFRSAGVAYNSATAGGERRRRRSEIHIVQGRCQCPRRNRAGPGEADGKRGSE